MSTDPQGMEIIPIIPPKKKPITLFTVVLFCFFATYNAEIITGSHLIEIIVVDPWVALLGFVLYGFQVVILADVAARY